MLKGHKNGPVIVLKFDSCVVLSIGRDEVSNSRVFNISNCQRGSINYRHSMNG